MDRIGTISKAMSLRGFGQRKNRARYMARPFTGWDAAAMVFRGLLPAAALFLNHVTSITSPQSSQRGPV